VHALRTQTTIMQTTLSLGTLNGLNVQGIVCKPVQDLAVANNTALWKSGGRVMEAVLRLSILLVSRGIRLVRRSSSKS